MADPLCPPNGLSSRTIGAISMSAFLLAAILASTSLRLYARISLTKRLWWDDAASIMATIFGVTAISMGFYLEASGFGLHVECLTLPQMETISHTVEPTLLFINLTLICARTAVALLLYRLFYIENWIKWFLSVIVFATIVGCLFNSISGFYTESDAAGTINRAGGYTSSAVGLVSDLALATVPIFVIRRMYMTPKTKLLTVGVLALGYITASAALAKLISIHVMSDIDSSYADLQVSLCNIIELSVAIVAGNVPTTRPVFTKKHEQGPSPVDGPDPGPAKSSHYLRMEPHELKSN